MKTIDLGRSLRFAALLAMTAAFASLLVSSTSNADSLGEASSVLSSGILQGLAAKEICTCMYVIGVGDAIKPAPGNEARKNLCLDRASLPVSKFVLNQMIYIDVNRTPNAVRVNTLLGGELLDKFKQRRAIAVFEGENGCRLLTDQETQRLW